MLRTVTKAGGVTIIVSVVLGTGLSCGGHSVGTCRASAAPTIKQPAQRAKVATAASAHARRARHAKARKATRKRIAARVHPRPATRTPASAVTSTSQRRFQAFISIASVSDNAMEPLRIPRLDAGQLNPETALPIRASEDAATPLTAERAVDGAPAPREATARQIEVLPPQVAAPATAPEPGGFNGSWLELIFVTWGVLLTIGSAVRLMVA